MRTLQLLLLILALKAVACFQFRLCRCCEPLSLPQRQRDATKTNNGEHSTTTLSRRNILQSLSIGATGIIISPRKVSAAISKQELVQSLQKAKDQMSTIPDLIKAKQWDSVRAILITPPLSDLWSKKSDILLQYADVVEDELEVLELKEEIQGHLRFLDMAVYNNVFNPITTMGETGATKQLIKSYYEDPINEYKASLSALEELIKIGQ